MRSFLQLAEDPAPPLDELTLALTAEFKPVEPAAVFAYLDLLGAEVADVAARQARTAAEQAGAIAGVLHGVHRFEGDTDRYDDPRNSMLDLVLERRRGLPILLSVVYVEVGRRAGLPLVGVGLPGHFVVGHFATEPPLLLDPFTGGAPVTTEAVVRPWGPHETAVRMLNNLVGSFQKRGDLARALHAAELRLRLPMEGGLREELEQELKRLKATLN